MSEQPEAPATDAGTRDDDNRRRFREALERKRGRTGAGAVPHEPGRAVAPTSNDKRQRTFRRKSG